MKNLNRNNHAYILGAGASKPDGIPLTSELVDCAFYSFGGKFEGQGFDMLLGPWDKEIAVKIYKPVFKFFDYFYKTDLVKKIEILYKEGFHPGSLSIATDRIEDFFTKIDYMRKGIDNFGLNLSKEEIEELLKKAWFVFFYPISYEAIGKKAKYYSLFINNLLQRQGIHCIISFNYDLMLEQAFYEMLKDNKEGGAWSLPEHLRWTYGLNFASRPNCEYYEFPKENDAKIFYYKLHGSLNFGYCPKDKKVSLYALHADAYIHNRFYKEELRCYDGTHASLPLLIPPIKKKEIDIPDMQLLWDKAIEFVANVREISIIGYSLPDVDSEALNLITLACTEQLEKVNIVNSNEQHREKIAKIFKNHVNKIVFYKSFESYLRVYTERSGE